VKHEATYEIEQTLVDAAGGPAPVLFVPHLLPVDRGILATIYADPVEGVSESDLFDALERAYADEPFVRVRSELPQIKDVRATNFCDITARGVEDETHPRRVVLFSATDNIVKGAAGQAVQNMNLLFGQEETAGLL
jgi:N-acetyl-gamma-glutamyl-phosphate reductase